MQEGLGCIGSDCLVSCQVTLETDILAPTAPLLAMRMTAWTVDPAQGAAAVSDWDRIPLL